MMKTGYSLLLATMLCTSGSPLAAAETVPQKAPDQTKITQTVQSLEKRVSKLENDPHFSFEAQNRLIDKSRESYEARLDGFNKQITAQQASTSREISIFMAAVGVFLAFLTLLATLLGPKAIKGWIDDKANEMTKNRLDEVVTEESMASILRPKIDTISEQFLQEFRENAEEEIEKIHDLRKEIEALPKTLGETLTDKQKQAVSKVDEVAEDKPDGERTADDWFAIGLKAFQEKGKEEEAYQALMNVMRLEETAMSIDNAALAAEKAGYNDEAERMYKRAIEADPKYVNALVNYASFLWKIRGDYDAAEAMYKRAIELDPKYVNVLVNYASFLWKIRGDHVAAEVMYKRALVLDPKNVVALGNYGNFLTGVRGVHDEAEAMYKRAIEADPEHANNLSNYANFLWKIRSDHGAAEAMYKRAIAVDMENAIALGNYATHLREQERYDEAEAMYKRALDLEPDQAVNLGNYAHLLLAQGKPEGEKMLRKALALPTSVPELPVELHFYRLAHFPDEGAEALAELKKFLLAGTRSKGWNFAPNIERAIKDGHPNPELLRALADVISKDAPLDGLDKFAEWKAA